MDIFAFKVNCNLLLRHLKFLQIPMGGRYSRSRMVENKINVNRRQSKYKKNNLIKRHIPPINDSDDDYWGSLSCLMIFSMIMIAIISLLLLALLQFPFIVLSSRPRSFTFSAFASHNEGRPLTTTDRDRAERRRQRQCNKMKTVETLSWAKQCCRLVAQ